MAIAWLAVGVSVKRRLGVCATDIVSLMLALVRACRLAAGSIDVENVKDVLYDMLKNAGDEEIDTIAQEKIKQWDTNGDGKVTLSDFTEYVIKSIAAEKDPWEFAQE